MIGWLFGRRSGGDAAVRQLADLAMGVGKLAQQRDEAREAARQLQHQLASTSSRALEAELRADDAHRKLTATEDQLGDANDTIEQLRRDLATLSAQLEPTPSEDPATFSAWADLAIEAKR